MTTDCTYDQAVIDFYPCLLVLQQKRPKRIPVVRIYISVVAKESAFSHVMDGSDLGTAKTPYGP